MFDAVINLWPLWLCAFAGWLLVKVCRLAYVYRRRTRRM